MRYRRAALLCAGFFLVTSYDSQGTIHAEPLLVGTAKLELTPPHRTPLAGYSRRKGRLATGAHDPLFVRALVLQEGQTRVALVSCDLLIIDEALFEAVRRRLDATHPHVPLTLLLAATHTHSGPGAYGHKFFEKMSMGHFDPVVFDWLVERMMQAIEAASAHPQAATVRWASASTTGLVMNRMIAGGITDPELSTVTFEGTQRNPIALIVNFAAHPTTLGAWNMQYSADYPGVLTHTLEQRYPGAVCLFTAGAVGDEAPVKQRERFDRAQWLGEALAQQALSVLGASSEQREDTPTLRADQRVMRLSPAHLRLGRFSLPSWLSQPFVDDDATLTLVVVDHVMLIGVPCDLSAELGLELKRYAQTLGYHALVVGFADDYIGYCMPERLYRTGRYESSMAFNGPKTGDDLVKELQQMMNEMSGSVTGSQ